VTAQLLVPVDVDLRAFNYPLAALTQKVTWALDAKKAELTRAVAALHAARREVAQLQEGIDVSTRHVAALLGAGPNPLAHRTHLQYLVQCKAALRAALGGVDAAQKIHAEVQRQWAALQARHDGLARHRSEAMGVFIQESRHQQAGERDRDWLARSGLASALIGQTGESP
jgi:hypothetical protein